MATVQLQKHEDSAQDMLELERLREHFDPFLRSQTSSSGGPAQSMLPSTGSTATLAASAALQSSNLLRDVPSLANSRYASSLLGLSSRGARKAAGAHREELPEYEAVNSWTSGRATGGQLGVMGVREEGRRELVKLAEREELISGLTQRWQSPWDQPVRAR